MVSELVEGAGDGSPGGLGLGPSRTRATRVAESLTCNVSYELVDRRGGQNQALEEFINVDGDVQGSALVADDLQDALTVGVVAVLGVDGGLGGGGGLGAVGGQAVGVVPLEEPAGRLAQEIAAGVVAVGVVVPERRERAGAGCWPYRDRVGAA